MFHNMASTVLLRENRACPVDKNKTTSQAVISGMLERLFLIGVSLSVVFECCEQFTWEEGRIGSTRSSDRQGERDRPFKRMSTSAF